MPDNKLKPKSAGKKSNPDDTDLDRFAEISLQLPIYPWQRRVMKDLSQRGCRVAVKAANGSGKTRFLAGPAAIWHMCAYPNSVTVVTSGVYRQVKEQMFPYIRSVCSQFGNMFNVQQTTIDCENGSRMIGFSTDDPGRFEGWHNDNLFMVIDEAKSIVDGIFEAVERCQPSRILVMSSPGPTEGAFHRIWDREMHLWKTHTVTAYDCPHLDKKWIEAQKLKWGEDHPLIKSMIYGEFMDLSSHAMVIPFHSMVSCRDNPPRKSGNQKVAGLDFAAGGDENVICWRDGNEIRPLICWREKDTMKAVGRFILEMRRIGVEASSVYADDGGLGKPMVDRLWEMGWQVNRVNFGGKPSQKKTYQNKGAEIWWETSRAIDTHDIILPKDDATLSQLTSRRGATASSGKLGVEPKDNMRERGLPSPDRADALCLCVTHNRYAKYSVDNYKRPDLFELMDPIGEDTFEALGIYSGL